MEYLITANDYRDKDALARRLNTRPKHIALMDQLKKQNKILYGAALLNEVDQMVGSIIITNFASRIELDEYLKIEPYVTEKVWETIEIKRCQVGQLFK